MNGSDIETCGLIGPIWDKSVEGKFNDNLPPKILKEYFGYKEEKEL